MRPSSRGSVGINHVSSVPSFAEPHVSLQVNIDVELISIDPVAGTFVIDIDPFFYVPGETKDCSVVRREFNIFIDEYVRLCDPQIGPPIYDYVQEPFHEY